MDTQNKLRKAARETLCLEGPFCLDAWQRGGSFDMQRDSGHWHTFRDFNMKCDRNWTYEAILRISIMRMAALKKPSTSSKWAQHQYGKSRNVEELKYELNGNLHKTLNKKDQVWKGVNKRKLVFVSPRQWQECFYSRHSVLYQLKEESTQHLMPRDDRSG